MIMTRKLSASEIALDPGQAIFSSSEGTKKFLFKLFEIRAEKTASRAVVIVN